MTMAAAKKVLIVCDKNPCTSFGRLASDVSVSLQMAGYFTKILWLAVPRYFPQGVPKEDEAIYAKNLYSGFYTFRKPLKKVLYREDPDIVFWIRPEIGFLVPVARKALPKTRMVVMVHDTFAETLYPKSLKFRLFKMLFADPAKGADHYVYVSEYTKSAAEQYYGKPRVSSAVIGNPIRNNLFFFKDRGTSDQRSLFWKEHGVSGFRGVCLNVSLDEPRKNLKTFFEVARLNPDVAFVRVGRLRPSTRKMLDSLDLKNVFHFYEIPDELLVDFYRNADLMLYPSFVEGFGLPPIEAIACGTPAVAAETSGLAENLKGVVPLLNDPEDAEGFSQILRCVLSGEKIVDEAAAQKMLERCSLEAFSKRLSDFMSTAVG